MLQVGITDKILIVIFHAKCNICYILIIFYIDLIHIKYGDN